MSSRAHCKRARNCVQLNGDIATHNKATVVLSLILVDNMTHQILPPSDVFHTFFALFEYTTSAHYTTYLDDLYTELTLAFSALAIGVRACFLS